MSHPWLAPLAGSLVGRGLRHVKAGLEIVSVDIKMIVIIGSASPSGRCSRVRVEALCRIAPPIISTQRRETRWRTFVAYRLAFNKKTKQHRSTRVVSHTVG